VTPDDILSLTTPAANAARDAVRNEFGTGACAHGFC
jgi:hypothetical protein